MEKKNGYPKVSIITVYYNRAYCVKQSVDSLLGQTFRDFELLLVDDGSTDTTLEEFGKFNDDRVKIVSHSNMGFTNSMIKAVEQAKGEYIAVHGSGDISFPERISKLVAFLDNNKDYVIAAPRFERYDEETLEKIEESPFMGDLEYNDFLKNCRLMHGAVVFRKSAYNKVGGYERAFKNTQDWDLFLRFLRIGKGRVIDEVLYRQYKRRDGFSADPVVYEKICRISALRILLSEKSEQRKEILERVYNSSIEAVIPNSNPYFQRIFINNATMLVRRGRHVEFLGFTTKINSRELKGRQKRKYFFWVSVAKLMVFFNMDKEKAKGAFARLKHIKDRVAKTLYKYKYN